MEKLTMGTIILMIATFVFIFGIATGIYEHAFVMPAWFKSAPQSFALISEHDSIGKKFWIPLQILTLLSLVLALIFNWGNPTRRMLLIIPLVVYVFVATVSGAYFAPKILAWGKMDTAEAFSQALTDQSQHWLTLSWGLREMPGAIASIIMLIALTI